MGEVFQLLSDFLYVVSTKGVEDIPRLMAYLLPFLVIWTFYRKSKHSLYKWGAHKLQTAHESGAEPPSLHPIIDYNKCLGCGTCIPACPEGTVLGVINDKAFLVDPSLCIGHGACMTACPQSAITLVFGTANKGIDIPHIKPNFETNVPGIFIAGELGGMGLIRNAIEQGRQAMEHIHKKPGLGQGKALDVVIVGAGPAGFCATLYAIEHRLRYVTIEQDSFGGTVAHFPRGKIVMTAPGILPIHGKFFFSETTKEELLKFWEGIAKKSGVKIFFKEHMENIAPAQDNFVVETAKHRFLTKNVLLTIGRRGTPRKLGVSGEELNKVVYSLTDSSQYQNQHVLVVGGGNSALEAAHSIANEPGTTVTLSYRSKSFSKAAEKNKKKIKEAEQAQRMRVIMESNVKKITDTRVTIEQHGKMIEIKNEAVLVCAGGVLPMPMLKKIGIEVETKHGTP